MNLKIKKFNKRSKQELYSKLFELLREEFNFRVKRVVYPKTVKGTHFLKNVRRDIAIIKMLLDQDVGSVYDA
ncbi:50S ribosomal protein L29 [Candidatus Westeberhardia cardiocondylae]|uniref:Large ribosomal subunit protein uL29 n=1 Tax=Candidatus Westeberhardia cardiocondylae TaxID=1594731 RepID=A0A0H5BWG9_9ENTR|nr:50S ribosomal protein L29 [Candidatus Westeberhardia cardiocondylae]MCR3756170.1 50s ribosomal protein L29 [Candidatus Westeberhardia cardiocondylae]CEN32047.1 50S ribosomal protein L29 [Candidatus Westeberhardia cardiocondylae]